jgi:hypothetical protein
MKYLSFLVLFLLIVSFGNAQSNNALKPGKMYDSGDEIFGPRAGIKSVIPEGWAGMLPQGSEVFLLMSQDGQNGEMYAAANFDDDIESAKKRWSNGVELVSDITVKSTENSGMRGSDIYYSELEIIQHRGIKPQSKAYAEIKCGPFGNCVAVMLVYSSGDYDKQVAALTSFMDKMEFFEPREGNLYADFDWSEFLSSKYLTSFRYTDTSGKQNQIWLCPDGTFKSIIKRKGLAKTGDKSLNGKKNGTWKAEGVGEKGVLLLKMKKVPEEIRVELRVEEDKFYSIASGDRVYIMENFECGN